MNRTLILTGAIACALAVAIGAFGAHALRGMLDARSLAVFSTANDYHFIHALGLILLGLAASGISPLKQRWLVWAGWTMAGGIVLFSGSLYLLAVTDERWLGMITPLGGVAFIVAWLLFVVSVWGKP